MQTILTVQEMRQSDAAVIASGISQETLIQRAAAAIFSCGIFWKGPVAIVCGKGNNGQDGVFLSRLLRDAGLDVTVYYCFAEPVPDLSGYAMVVDCLFGTGFHGIPEGPAAAAIETINRSGATIISVDINSGLNGDNGLGKMVVHSHLTVSLGCCQPGHFLGMAADVMERKINCDIGIPPLSDRIRLVEDRDIEAFFGVRKHFSNKGTYGYVALVGGCLSYSGAIRLAAMANAAMRSGAGVAMIAAPASLCPLLVPEILESTLFPLSEQDGGIAPRTEELDGLCRRCRVIAFGMGIGRSPRVEAALAYLLTCYEGTLLVDADGLYALSRLPDDTIKCKKCTLIITPHPGEFGQLYGCTAEEAVEAPLERAADLARRLDAVVLLKGPGTVVSDGRLTYVVEAGCPGMATAGSGDVLSGILAAVCAQRPEEPLLAAAVGAQIAGRAGELAEQESNPVSMTAGDTVKAIQKYLTERLNAKNGKI